jgi:hypothetical protein
MEGGIENCKLRMDKTRLRHLERLRYQVKVVAQPARGGNLVAGFFGGPAPGIQKTPPVSIVLEAAG